MVIADILASLEDALRADDWSAEAHGTIQRLVDTLNDPEMTDKEYERYTLLLRKF